MTDYVVRVKQALVPLTNGRTVIVSRGYQVPADALPATVTHLLAIGAIEVGEGAAIGGIGPDLDGEGNPIGAAPSPTPPPYVRTVSGQGPDVAGNVDAGGGSFPDFTGSGSPEGVITAAVGKTYLDATRGALYFKGSGSGNTGWGTASVYHPGDQATPGVIDYLANGIYLLGHNGSDTVICDLAALFGSGNGIYWQPETGDGAQKVLIALGENGASTTHFNADGTVQFPGPIGVNGATPPAKADTPTTLADVIAILQAVGLCT
jgi:hypothetical protein